VVPAKLRGLRGRIREGHFDYILKPRHLARLARLYVLDRVGRRHYRMLSEAELRMTPTSDTAFVFGSGRSLVEITDEEWAAISRCNVISLREFPRQQWVRADYHVTSEVDFLDEYAERIRENPLYADTVFVVQDGFRAERGNELVGRRMLRSGARVFRFRRRFRGMHAPPSRSPRLLVHGYNSIFDGVNLAIVLGYSRIVLVGADYYNKEYFWLAAGETRANEPDGIVATAPWRPTAAIVSLMGEWSHELAQEGVELSVWNPRSLLSRTLPVFDRSRLTSFD
jgi:hypothetical protein